MTANERYAKFHQECEDAGYEVEQYKGRNFYSGPAVRISATELEDIVRATTVKLQWDTMGWDGLIVYPV